MSTTLAPPQEDLDARPTGTTTDPRWLSRTMVLLALAATVKLGVRAVQDPDAWWHLRAGAWVLSGWHFDGPDPWVPFSSRPFVLTQWLPEVVAHWVYGLFGLPGLAWLRCAAMLAMLAAMFWASRRVADTVPAMIAALAGLVGCGGSLSERPQLVSFVLLAVTVGAWWKSAEDLRPRWWLVPLTWLWACCHGLWGVGVGLGVVVIAGLVLDRRLDARSTWRLAAVPLASVVAAALTPVGPALLLTPFQVSQNAARFVQEWQPTAATDSFAALTLAMLVLAVLPWVRMPGRPPWWQVGLAATAFVSTLAMFRTVPVGAVIAAPLMAAALQRLRRRPRAALSRRGVRGFAAVLVVAAVAAAPLAASVAEQPQGWPQGLRPRLASLPAHSVVLNDFAVGGWLLWAEPQLTPVIDLRSEIYSMEYIRSYRTTEQVRPGWQAFLDRTHPEYALLRTRAPLVGALREQLHWRALGTDHGYVLLAAPQPAAAPLPAAR